MRNFIFGSTGFAKEVEFLMYDISLDGKTSHQIESFVGRDDVGKKINNVDIIDEPAFFNLIQQGACSCYLAIGSPSIRNKIFDRLKQNSNIEFPSLIHPSVVFDRRNAKISLEMGSIICAGNILTTDIKIGKFVHLNLDCTVGHDSFIEDFVTISPGCHISGNVHIGKNVFVGTGAVILERLKICDNAVIGAGAVVTKDITEPGVYVGMPARRLIKDSLK